MLCAVRLFHNKPINIVTSDVENKKPYLWPEEIYRCIGPLGNSKKIDNDH